MRDLSGFRVIRAPRFTSSVGADYQHEFGWGVIDASTTLFYSSSFAWEPLGRIRQGSYANWTAQLGWSPSARGVRIGVYGRNLTNEKVTRTETTSAVSDHVGYNPPREIGVSLSMTF